jgi:hypothetical protein
MPRRLEDKLKGQDITRKANLDRSLADESTRTIPFILVSSENEGVRYDWWSDEEFIEKLDVNGANYERLQTFFKDHNRSVDSAIGRVQNVRVEDGSLKGDVVFGSDDESMKIFRKYADGILTDVSIGYRVNASTIEERKGEPSIVTITDFEIRELSAVGIGFDKGATIGRNQNTGDEMNEELRKELLALRAKVDKTEEDQKRLDELINVEAKANQESIAAEKSRSDDVVNKERQRVSEIHTLASAHSIDSERTAKFISDGVSVDEVRKAILDIKVERSTVVTGGNKPGESDMKRAMEDAIAIRCGFTPKQTHEDVRMFAGASMLDMARAMSGYDGYDKNELIKRAMGSSDFPILLGNVANKVVAGSFEEAEGTFGLWTQSVDLPDFKIRTEARLSNQNGRLKKLTELGEKKSIEFTENGEQWRIFSYGNGFKLSREMLINDDLGVFTGIVSEFGAMAKRTANGIVYDLLQGKGDYASYKMADGKAIFHADHNNLSASGAALASATLTAARVAMRRQKDGNIALNINPKHLIVSPENETTARQLLTSEADIGSSNSGVSNPHRNSLDPIIESELDAAPWYLAAARNTIKVGYLQGTGRQPIVEEVYRGVDGTEYKCVFDFGVVAQNYRGLYKNLGA